jgi:hypothetical protein
VTVGFYKYRFTHGTGIKHAKLYRNGSNVYLFYFTFIHNTVYGIVSKDQLVSSAIKIIFHLNTLYPHLAFKILKISPSCSSCLHGYVSEYMYWHQNLLPATSLSNFYSVSRRLTIPLSDFTRGFPSVLKYVSKFIELCSFIHKDVSA